VNTTALERTLRALIGPLQAGGHFVLELARDYPRLATFAIVSVPALITALVLGGWSGAWQTAALFAFGGLAWFNFRQ
jgi:NADH:ubiquinone oxidoreductase subunit H